MVEAASPEYIPARYHGGHQSTITRVVVHATVSPCKPGGARDIARYFQDPPVETSAHYVVDPEEVIQCVRDDTVAYHAPPNEGSIGVELCDPQDGPDSRWDGDVHRAMLERAAGLVHRLCEKYEVPTRWLYPDDLRAGHSGITDHENVSIAFGESSHTDPGWSTARSDGFVTRVNSNKG